MRKEEAIRIIARCAKSYHENLENKNLLFLFGHDKNPEFFEASFLPRHFLHLTGVELSNRKSGGSSNFYKKALNGKLSPRDFYFAEDGTTTIKLEVLPQLTEIYRSAKMVGDYNYTKPTLYTEKLAGNVTACLGFIRENNYYLPNTALREDVRSISKHPQQRILAIFRKPIHQVHYMEVVYIAKGLTIQDISIPPIIKPKIYIPSSPNSEKA